jgi:hypothetical protein
LADGVQEYSAPEMLEPKRVDVTGDWRRLPNEKLHDLYFSSNIFWAIKSRIIRLAGHVTYIGRRELHTIFWWGNLKERDHLED